MINSRREHEKKKRLRVVPPFPFFFYLPFLRFSWPMELGPGDFTGPETHAEYVIRATYNIHFHPHPVPLFSFCVCVCRSTIIATPLEHTHTHACGSTGARCTRALGCCSHSRCCCYASLIIIIIIIITLCLSRIDPLPKMAILVSVSSWSRLRELPLGPSSFPTKLNCIIEKEKTGEK